MLQESFSRLAHFEDVARVWCRCCLKQGFIGVKLCENVREPGCVQNLTHNAQAGQAEGRGDPA